MSSSKYATREETLRNGTNRTINREAAMGFIYGPALGHDFEIGNRPQETDPTVWSRNPLCSECCVKKAPAEMTAAGVCEKCAAKLQAKAASH